MQAYAGNSSSSSSSKVLNPRPLVSRPTGREGGKEGGGRAACCTDVQSQCLAAIALLALQVANPLLPLLSTKRPMCDYCTPPWCSRPAEPLPPSAYNLPARLP